VTSTPSDSTDKAAPRTDSTSPTGASQEPKSVTEVLALPVLERHGQASDGQLSVTGSEDPGSSRDRGGGSGSSTATGDERTETARSCEDEDEDDRDMPQLTLYA